jgi:hypothetical protein
MGDSKPIGRIGSESRRARQNRHGDQGPQASISFARSTHFSQSPRWGEQLLGDTLNTTLASSESQVLTFFIGGLA